MGRRVTGIFLNLAIIVLAMAAPLAQAGYSQRSDGVFVGRGRVARPDPRARADSRGGDARERRAYSEDDLKPMVPPRMLREIATLEQQCLDEVNRQRAAHDLAPLELSVDLLEVARFYSRRMAEEKFFAHIDPQGRNVRNRVDAAGIKWRVLGENLAYTNGYVNPVAASMRGWMESPGHRKNILDPDYRRTAIGAWITDSGTVFFTEIFLK
jgi:uncharacterized protein YkwD